MIKAIFFDLDGTLLPMDQDKFIECYFKLLCEKLAPLGYEPKKLIDALWKGIYAMIKNDGAQTNAARFWEVFTGIFGEKALRDQPVFDEFYHVEFEQVRQSCGFHPDAAKLVRTIKDAGFRVILATNPIFPQAATHRRIRWAGLAPSDFELCTTYENIGFCKPNPHYYTELIKRLGLSPAECLMVGNDVTEDMVAGTVGMQVFLLTDCLINKEHQDISVYANGGFSQLLSYLRIS